MNKDFINRILNVSELLVYLLVIYTANCPYCFSDSFIGNGTTGNDIYNGGLIPALLVIIFLRVCLNYIFQFKLNDSIIILAARKILNKFKKN